MDGRHRCGSHDLHGFDPTRTSVPVATLGLAVLAMAGFMLADGQPVPAPQLVVFCGISLAGLALTARFVRAVGSGADAAERNPASGRAAESRP